MKDQFANYVVQKVLETCDDQQLELILNRIKVHLNALKKYTYGKHIVARVEKLVAAGGILIISFILIIIDRFICILVLCEENYLLSNWILSITPPKTEFVKWLTEGYLYLVGVEDAIQKCTSKLGMAHDINSLLVWEFMARKMLEAHIVWLKLLNPQCHFLWK